MDPIIKQNQDLRAAVEDILEEIDKQKELNQQHQTEIETLLKFNHRLLAIIQSQVQDKDHQSALHPISERSERESDLISNAMNSLIKSRQVGVKSQRGPNTTNSLVAPKNNPIMTKNKERLSEIDNSFDIMEIEERQLEQKTAYPFKSPPSPSQKKTNDLEKAVRNSVNVKKEMSREISELKRFKKDSLTFYDKKIGEIKGLSTKLDQYQPTQQLKQISEKLCLSANTSELIRKAMERRL